jgi:hypothetical protein
MSFPSWLQNLCSAPAPGRGQRQHQRRGSLRAATVRPNLEALEDRLTPSFTTVGDFPVGLNPQVMITGDFNNDGHPDLAAVDPVAGNVSVLLGDGRGAFGVPRLSAAGAADWMELAVAEFNNDGKLDLAIVNHSSAVLSVLLGNGDGTFRPPINTAILPRALALAAADFDADGNMDLVYTAAGANGGWGSVEVLLGNGQGGFPARRQYLVHAEAPKDLAVADLNADGRPDVVTTNTSTASDLVFSPETVGVLLGNGDGTLSYEWSASNFAAGSDLLGLAVGDFTSDGIPDLVTKSNDGYGAMATVLPGLGNGTFAAPINSYDGYYGELAVADFDGDGNLDVLTEAWPGFASLLLGLGDGHFAFHEEFGGSPPSAVADFNRDGRPDLAEASGDSSVSISLNDSNGAPLPLSLRIDNVAVTEGNTGTVAATFTVFLSATSAETVTVAYATANGSAAAGSDYQAASGILTFAPGETSKAVTVLVNGDRLLEPNETFLVNLSSATNATITDGQGVGTIVDDEPRISISDVAKKEGKKNQTTLFTFTVTLSAAYDQPVTMSFQTANGTATTSDGDYVAKTGTLTFAPGETTKTITITVNGDNKKEADETFYLDLFGNSSNSLFTKSRGIGTILNDD